MHDGLFFTILFLSCFDFVSRELVKVSLDLRYFSRLHRRIREHLPLGQDVLKITVCVLADFSHCILVNFTLYVFKSLNLCL